METSPHTTNLEKTKAQKRKYINGVLLSWLLAVGITIVANMLVHQALDLWYQQPKHETFCPVATHSKSFYTKDSCESVGGSWNESNSYDKSRPISVDNTNGYCDAYVTCGQKYEVARSGYNKVAFIIIFSIGMVSLLVGYNIKQKDTVSLGLTLAGIVMLLTGAGQYWSDIGDYIKLILLVLALAVLIWVGIKKTKDTETDDK